MRGENRRTIALIVLVCIVAAGTGTWWLARPRPPLVQVGRVQQRTLENKVFASGTVKALRRQVVNVTDLVVPVATFNVLTGAAVHPGEVLITGRNDAQLAAVQAAQTGVSSADGAYNQAVRQLTGAPSGIQAQLHGAVDSARAALAQAEAQLAQARSAYSATLVRAQFDGTVIVENPGGLAPDGTPAPLMEVVGPGKQIIAQVSEVDAVRLHPGQAATVTSDAFPAQSWRAQVSRVAAYAVTGDTGSGQVEVDLAPPPTFPVPFGYQTDVRIVSAVRHKVPVLPYDALVQDGSTYAVFTYQNGRVHQVNVVLGITGDAVVEVARGVQAGTAVVLNPPSGLADGQAVRTK